MKTKPSRLSMIYPIYSMNKKTMIDSFISTKESIDYYEVNKSVKDLSAFNCSEYGF
jgi:hypothetical protein